jgi:hypothetical protein
MFIVDGNDDIFNLGRRLAMQKELWQRNAYLVAPEEGVTFLAFSLAPYCQELLPVKSVGKNPVEPNLLNSLPQYPTLLLGRRPSLPRANPGAFPIL